MRKVKLRAEGITHMYKGEGEERLEHSKMLLLIFMKMNL